MFRPAPNNNLIEIKFSDFAISASATTDELPILEKLVALMKLLSEKYGTEYALGRFDKQSPNSISLSFSTSGFVKVGDRNEQLNLQPIMYLQNFGKASQENKTPYPHLTSVVITIDKDKIDDAMEGLKLLATMTKEEVEDRHRSVVSMAC